MAEKPKSQAAGNDNVGQSGTDSFPTYQDEKALKAADKDAVGGGSADSADPNRDEVQDAPAAVELNHGEESPAAKAEREALENNPYSPVPAQQLPENQDETVAPKKQ